MPPSSWSGRITLLVQAARQFGHEAEANELGERLIWLEDAMADLLFPPSATVLCSARRG